MPEAHPGVLAIESPRQSALARLLSARQDLQRAHLALADAKDRVTAAQHALGAAVQQ
jgi:hypothetical protein